MSKSTIQVQIFQKLNQDAEDLLFTLGMTVAEAIELSFLSDCS